MKEGDEFEEGDVLCEVETDKAVVAFEAVGLEGYLAKIFTPDGTKDIKVGDMVCIVVENKEDVAAFVKVRKLVNYCQKRFLVKLAV